MSTFHFWHRETGHFHNSSLMTDDLTQLAVNVPKDHDAIEGSFDSQSQRVDLEKANAQREARLAAHATRVGSMRETFMGGMSGDVFQEPVAPLFLPTADVLTDYQPPQPSTDYEWNATIKRWELSAAVVARNAKRSAALARIAQLESSQARPLRELARDATNADARTRLDRIDVEIATLRADLT